MFNTLYKKLATMLFFILLGIGILLFFIVRYASEMYQQEVNQKLNAQIAKHIVEEDLLLDNGEINRGALKNIFHMMMVINPSIELYLLDENGKVLSYSAPDKIIKRDSIDLGPIKAFINQSQKFPLLGDNPRDLSGEKTFTAAPIYSNKSSKSELQGYLYIILGSDIYDNIIDLIKNSYILKVSILGIFAALIIALLSGLLSFSMLTKRLTRLSKIMSSFLSGRSEAADNRYLVNNRFNDEIDTLGENYNLMADRIEQQLQELKDTDAKRRELIANVSHDLRTPLTSLHGYLETLQLKEATLTGEERQRYLNIVISQSNRLKQLINELFELAKLDSLETLLSIEPFSLPELIQDVTQKYTLIAKNKEILIRTELKQDIPPVFGDIALIQRALENLIDNALRHTPKGGTITLALSEHQQNITVKVSDTGCGIDKDDIEFIFDRFYQANKDKEQHQEHSGLGLAITKKIIALHGSHIIAKSIPNEGTTFSFDLPAHLN